MNLFICTYNNQNAFEISKQHGILGFSTKNRGNSGTLERIEKGDLILLRDSRIKKELGFFGLLQALDKMQIVGSDAELIWPDEVLENKVVFTKRLPVQFIQHIYKRLPKEIVLSWKWKKRYPDYNEYSWTGYTRLFSGNLLSEEQKKELLSHLDIDPLKSLTPLASDLNDADSSKPQKVLTEIYRILRDTALARKVKAAHNFQCQICGALPIQLLNGNLYAEAHHIKPLGRHAGEDVEENIICVCPTCHAKLDYGVIELDEIALNTYKTHSVSSEFIEYHNQKIFGKL